MAFLDVSVLSILELIIPKNLLKITTTSMAPQTSNLNPNAFLESIMVLTKALPLVFKIMRV